MSAAFKFKPVEYDKVEQAIVTDNRGKHDFKVSMGDLVYTDKGTFRLRGDGTAALATQYKVTDWAFGQFCTKLGVPSTYLRKCPISGPGGRMEQIKMWQERQPKLAEKEFLIRAKKASVTVQGTECAGVIRAFLGGDYLIIDNAPLWNYLGPFLKRNDLVIQQANLTDVSFHIRALYKEVIKVPTKLDAMGIHYAGLHTSNSEVGARYLQGDFVIYREVCKNGMIAQFGGKPLFRQKHLKTKIDPTQLRAMLSSGLEGVQHHKVELMESLLSARIQKVENPKKTIETVMKLNRQPNEVIDAAKLEWEKESLATVFGVVQAITSAAKILAPDKRVELENIAGRYLLTA